MKLRIFIILFVLIGLLTTSCSTNEIGGNEPSDNETLNINSNISGLLKRVTSNDGSKDNIIDQANCFDVIFPYVVNANNNQITLNSSEDFASVECVFDASDDDIDNLNIIYPISIRLSDFSEISIANTSDLNSYIANCNGENIEDDDIECLDFLYPFSASIFNPTNEFLDTITFNADDQLYDFIENLDVDDIVSINFPLNVAQFDGTEITINTLDALEILIESNQNTCDEDDDYDYNEDDCDHCSITEIENILTSCTDWTVNTLRRNNDTNYDTIYYDYAFNFSNDGSLDVSWSSTTVLGTWTATGSGNNIEIVINIPSLPLCNANWILREIKNCSVETEIDLRVGSDRIQYVRNCN